MSMMEKLNRKVKVLVAWLFIALLSCGLYAAPVYADDIEPGSSGSIGSESGTESGEARGSWRIDGHGWWYEFVDGSYPSSRWLDLDGTWYWFDANGYMATGWQVVNGSWYYMEPSGAMAMNQWIDDYYVGSDGAWIPGYSSGGSFGTWDGVTVYWTANGKAWHKSRSCPSLSRSNPIQGTLSQVGGRTMCKVCGGH